MSHWAIPYLGAAWCPKTHDCWGFFRRAQREVFGRDIPAVVPENYRSATKAELLNFHPHRLAWQEIGRDELRDGDGVRMSSASDPGHVGIWAEIDGGRVVHCDEPYGVAATPLAEIAEIFSDIRFYRYVGDACQP